MQEKQIYSTSTIAEMTNGIILAKFEKTMMHDAGSYQSEAELENSMISNLVSQGYERLFAKTNEDLYINLKKQIERLNDVTFSKDEWSRFLIEYLDTPNDTMIEKTGKVQENHI